MLIVCKIKRDGPTHINLEKFAYVFTERPELTGGSSAKVAQVLSTSHQQYFLSLPDFEEFQPEVVKDDKRGAKAGGQKQPL